MADRKTIRCAIYTRKSTEEGLEQDFNSLDAQREACAAYVASHRHEGWVLIDEQYDDGGYSGGNMDRPGMVQLLGDVRNGKIDVIVVYKVDRLTRSLADFAKIVEILDEKGASFVSVTQSFNTSNSMGRLTLNVLLSFAQFEREVTGERIRDKVAASKQKGMFMGGSVALGYDLKDRKLLVNEQEACTVRHIFERYAELKSVTALAEELAHTEHRTKRREYKTGKIVGGIRFQRGALAHILQNRLYVGEVVHQGKAFAGEHEAIVNPEVFDCVQSIMRGNRRQIGHRSNHVSILAGMMFDTEGRPMSPTHANRNGKRYRYYYARLRAGEGDGSDRMRVPAGEIEKLVCDRLGAFFENEGELGTSIGSRNAETIADGLKVGRQIANSLTGNAAADIRKTLKGMDFKMSVDLEEIRMDFSPLKATLPEEEDDGETATVTVQAKLAYRGPDHRFVISPGQSVEPARKDSTMIKLMTTAHAARQTLVDGKESELAVGYSKAHLARMARLSFLAPDIVSAILDGTQPVELTTRRLLRATNIPLDWAEQRKFLGFSA